MLNFETRVMNSSYFANDLLSLPILLRSFNAFYGARSRDMGS